MTSVVVIFLLYINYHNSWACDTDHLVFHLDNLPVCYVECDDSSNPAQTHATLEWLLYQTPMPSISYNKIALQIYSNCYVEYCE